MKGNNFLIIFFISFFYTCKKEIVPDFREQFIGVYRGTFSFYTSCDSNTMNLNLDTQMIEDVYVSKYEGSGLWVKSNNILFILYPVRLPLGKNEILQEYPTYNGGKNPSGWVSYFIKSDSFIHRVTENLPNKCNKFLIRELKSVKII